PPPRPQPPPPASPPSPDVEQLPKRLSSADAQLLEDLLKEFLFDPPKEAKRVRIQAPAHIRGESRTEQVAREGWLVAGNNGEPGRVSFTDGESLAAPKEFTEVDFMT